MGKSLYSNGEMYTEDLEAFDFMIVAYEFKSIHIVNCVAYINSKGSVFYKVAVTLDDDYDHSYGYTQFLEEFGFIYRGHVGA